MSGSLGLLLPAVCNLATCCPSSVPPAPPTPLLGKRGSVQSPQLALLLQAHLVPEFSRMFSQNGLALGDWLQILADFCFAKVLPDPEYLLQGLGVALAGGAGGGLWFLSCSGCLFANLLLELWLRERERERQCMFSLLPKLGVLPMCLAAFLTYFWRCAVAPIPGLRPLSQLGLCAVRGPGTL